MRAPFQTAAGLGAGNNPPRRRLNGAAAGTCHPPLPLQPPISGPALVLLPVPGL